MGIKIGTQDSIIWALLLVNAGMFVIEMSLSGVPRRTQGRPAHRPRCSGREAEGTDRWSII
ncbi:MAG: hypothetical protein BMS9Abin28_1042 [Anaerolineae bacterium]|nr:MAG: hypothetical protein BMS9Abin28_1042 [Anaerolineae bacterium]